MLCVVKNNIKQAILLAILLTAISFNCNAQRVAVSTNAIYWGMLSPNLSVELGLSRHSSVSLEASALPWNINDKFSIAHLSVVPEYKYWFTMPFYGHYTGVNALYSSYQRVKDSVEKTGNIIALGVSYGYAFIINKRWNIVPHIAIGGGIDFSSGKREFVFVPTKAGINLQMVIK